MTPEVEIVSEPERPLSGLAGKKFEGCTLRDLDSEDLKFAKRFARGGAIRHEIAGLLAERFWRNKKRLAHELHWRPDREAR